MWGPATFVLGLLSLVQAQSDRHGQLTVCIVEAYNLENLDADEPFGGSASDPYAACCTTSAPRSLIFDPTDGRYATVKVGDQECSTVTLKDSTSAVWNHCCSFGTGEHDRPEHLGSRTRLTGARECVWQCSRPRRST